MRHLTAEQASPAGTEDPFREALEGALVESTGRHRRIVALERCPSAYRSSATIEQLYVRLDDGERLELMFKDLSAHALNEAARRAKPSFLHNPRREIAVYQHILARGPSGPPRLYGAVIDPARGRSWLFIEHVRGTELYQLGDREAWRAAARWLAGMHVCFAGRADLDELVSAGRLLRYDRDFYRLWPDRARHLARLAAQQQPTVRERLDRIVARYDVVQERLLALPPTLIHGEFYPSNILIQNTASGPRVCPVDWEMAACGPGVLDLAALTSGSWSDDERADLALTYRDGIAAVGGSAPSADELLEALDWCRLHVAMQWLGWSGDWQPPPEHAHDWLAEALQIAGRLSL